MGVDGLLSTRTPRQCTLKTAGQALGCRVALRYTARVIKSFIHKGLEAFFLTASKAGINPAHAPKLRRQLAQLDASMAARDMNIPGWRLHALTGDLAGHWAISVNGNWRLTFRFEDGDAVLVDYRDYH
jgi:proteic killer suppression protein